MPERARIVVGLDGSPDSFAALDCALTEAALHDAELVLCHVREQPRRGTTRDTPRNPLAQAERHARQRLPRLDVTRASATGDPARELLRRAEHALLLVVGARGTDRRDGLRLGRVSDHITRHAHHAVLVVPDAGGRARRVLDRTVVVGVDTAANSDTALAFAFAEATRRHADVRAIHVIEEAAPPTACRPSIVRSRRTLVADTLREQVSGHIARHPGVHACTEVLAGTPGRKLTAAASGSELLILGSCDRRHQTSLISGVTRSAILYNATCPVFLV